MSRLLAEIRDSAGRAGRVLRRSPLTLCIAFLVIAAVAQLAAWRVQGDAADALIEARRLSTADTEESHVEGPSLEDHQAILDVLDASIDVRQQIDETLTGLEGVVADLRAAQNDSRSISVQAGRETRTIAGVLGGATEATDTSLARLDDLRLHLQRSSELARLIALELEQLDENIGPGSLR